MLQTTLGHMIAGTSLTWLHSITPECVPADVIAVVECIPVDVIGGVEEALARQQSAPTDVFEQIRYG